MHDTLRNIICIPFPKNARLASDSKFNLTIQNNTPLSFMRMFWGLRIFLKTHKYYLLMLSLKMI